MLDDGKCALMRQVTAEEGVNYITRASNIGFKAGNLRNALTNTDDDFIIICDADTRLFPTILEHTVGYFHDPDVAWVQTPQWFFDIPEGTPLPDYLQQSLGSAIERVFGRVPARRAPFVNGPKMFYDILLRRRNWANAALCCNAGSLHRREAVMQAALRAFALSGRVARARK